mmetsp:Transcript_23160/g.33072  ORF Transcript_23160/g.33072 Transcript_23160/m.33072 type:complete len:131 (-) Transcript_23160:1346-1738(-)
MLFICWGVQRIRGRYSSWTVKVEIYVDCLQTLYLWYVLQLYLLPRRRKCGSPPEPLATANASSKYENSRNRLFFQAFGYHNRIPFTSTPSNFSKNMVPSGFVGAGTNEVCKITVNGFLNRDTETTSCIVD